MKKWFKEPLLHFLVIGALLFGLYALLNPEEASFADNRIIVSVGDIERLSTNWYKNKGRLPTKAELQQMVESYIREEVYYREALALGLDRNDTILRRRLMQKMEFLTNDIADLNSPDETTLNQYYNANREKYERSARISFSHIYFSLDKHGLQAADSAAKVLADIRSGAASTTHASDLGDSFMLRYDFILEDSVEISRLFGQEFAKQLLQLELNSWQGPIESGYGLHLIRISEKVDARMPDLATVIDKVRNDWLFEQRKRINKEVYERFRDRYEIVFEIEPESAATEAEKSS